jgi:hypothetical protein
MYLFNIVLNFDYNKMFDNKYKYLLDLDWEVCGSIFYNEKLAGRHNIYDIEHFYVYYLRANSCFTMVSLKKKLILNVSSKPNND